MENFDWQRVLFSVEGRISRSHFWIGVIIILMVHVVVRAVSGSEAALAVIGLALLYSQLAVYIKRCHDRGKSGWWCLLLLIPFVNFIWVIIDLGILKGTDGPNEYGPDPLAVRR